MKQYFILFSNCIPVKGFLRSIICDLQNSNFEFIPNELYDILINHKKLSVNKIIDIYGKENKSIIRDYFDFLVKKDFGFYSENKITQLVPLNLEWKSAQLITNTLIDIKEGFELPFKKISHELDELNCESMELRFFSNQNFLEIEEVLNYFKTSTLRSIYLLLQYNGSITRNAIEKLVKNFPRIMGINISNSPKNEKINIFDDSVPVIFTTKNIDSEKHCGVIKPDFFSINIQHFTESQKHNTCLNRKISICSDGKIKNCPSMIHSYGNIRNITLKEVLIDKRIKKDWTLNKNLIKVCKDCEFRHICTDCRAYTNKNEKHEKPSKCNYNPYTATWEHID